MDTNSNHEENESSLTEEQNNVVYWKGRYDELKEAQQEILDLLEGRIKHTEGTLRQQYALKRSLVSGAMSSLNVIKVEEISGLVSIPLTIHGIVQFSMSGDVKIGSVSLISGLCFLVFALYKLFTKDKRQPSIQLPIIRPE